VPSRRMTCWGRYLRASVSESSEGIQGDSQPASPLPRVSAHKGQLLAPGGEHVDAEAANSDILQKTQRMVRRYDSKSPSRRGTLSKKTSLLSGARVAHTRLMRVRPLRSCRTPLDSALCTIRGLPADGDSRSLRMAVRISAVFVIAPPCLEPASGLLSQRAVCLRRCRPLALVHTKRLNSASPILPRALCGITRPKNSNMLPAST